MISLGNKKTKSIHLGKKPIRIAYSGNRIFFTDDPTPKGLIELNESGKIYIPYSAKNITFWGLGGGGGGMSGGVTSSGNGGKAAQIVEYSTEITKELKTKYIEVTIGNGGAGHKKIDILGSPKPGEPTLIKFPNNYLITCKGGGGADKKTDATLGEVPNEWKIEEYLYPPAGIVGAGKDEPAPWYGSGGGGGSWGLAGLNKNGQNGSKGCIWYKFSS